MPLAVDVEALAHRLQDAADEVARVEQREGDQEQVETVAHVPAKKEETRWKDNPCTETANKDGTWLR